MDHAELTQRIKAAEDLIRHYEQVASELIAQLPELPDPNTVELKLKDWQLAFQLEEYGYCRYTSAEWEGDHWHGYTDGWDDMSENGSFEYFDVNGLYWRRPDEFAWD